MGLSFLTDLLPLATQIYGQSQTNRAIKVNNVATPAERSSQALYAALADPNSPILKNLTASEDENNLNNFQQQITQMQLADRRAQAMGRSPTFFNPERADESINYLTTRGLPQLHQAARAAAMQRLIAAAGGKAGAMGAQATRQGINMQQGVSNAAYQSQVPQQILKLFNNNQSTPQNMFSMVGNSPGRQVPSISWGGG